MSPTAGDDDPPGRAWNWGGGGAARTRTDRRPPPAGGRRAKDPRAWTPATRRAKPATAPHQPCRTHRARSALDRGPPCAGSLREQQVDRRAVSAIARMGRRRCAVAERTSSSSRARCCAPVAEETPMPARLHDGARRNRNPIRQTRCYSRTSARASVGAVVVISNSAKPLASIIQRGPVAPAALARSFEVFHLHRQLPPPRGLRILPVLHGDKLGEDADAISSGVTARCPGPIGACTVVRSSAGHASSVTLQRTNGFEVAEGTGIARPG